VIARIKTARQLALRLPRWVEPGEVKVTMGGRQVAGVRVGNYLLCSDVEPGCEVELTFPVKEETVSFVTGGTEYRCRFRGNDLVDIEPRGEQPVYPMYVGRGSVVGGAAGRMPGIRTVSRYVASRILPW
jgi:hypothetical protein